MKESRTVVQQADGTWARQGPFEVLVNRESATYCSYDKDVIIPISEDHFNMVKLSEGDGNLVVILSTIIEICSQSRPGHGETTVNFPLHLQEGAIESNSGMDPSDPDNFSRTEEGKILTQLAFLLSSFDGLESTLYSPELDFRASQIEELFQDTFRWIFDLSIFANRLQ